MNYQDAMIISGVSFFIGMFGFGLFLMPVAFFFAHTANEIEPTRSAPTALMIASIVMFMLHVMAIMVFLASIPF